VSLWRTVSNHSGTWWTIVPTKAAVVAETPRIKEKGCIINVITRFVKVWDSVDFLQILL